MGVSERLSLEEATAPTLIACEHRHRYAFAAQFARGLRVLDLCCGSGYGSRMVAETALTVHGVDVDARTIDAAAAGLGDGANISFEAADALEFLNRDETAAAYDAIVCFEGLEHLPHVDATLDRLRALAEQGVKMLLSVPNSKGLDEENVYHLTDFSWEDATERIGSFPGATAMTQYLAEGSLICTAYAKGRELDASVALDDRDEPEYANHYVFLIGFDAPDGDGRMQLEASPAANRYMKSLERANTELRRTNQRLARERLGKADSAAGGFVAKSEAAERRAAQLEQSLEALEREHSAWVDRCHGAEERERRLQELLLRRQTPYHRAIFARLRGRS